ncbi:hypothetical protein ACWPKO_11865 [Coraliomargarita sp. W4R53]
MKNKILLLLIAGALLLPMFSGLFDLEARRRPNTVVVATSFVTDPQTTISPN